MESSGDALTQDIADLEALLQHAKRDHSINLIQQEIKVLNKQRELVYISPFDNPIGPS